MFDVAKRRRRFAHGVVCSETPRACGHNALVRARVVQKNPRDPVAGASRHDLDEPRA